MCEYVRERRSRQKKMQVQRPCGRECMVCTGSSGEDRWSKWRERGRDVATEMDSGRGNGALRPCLGKSEVLVPGEAEGAT